MIKEVVGVRLYSFPDSQTGVLIEGAKVYLQWVEEGTDGFCCFAGSISSTKLAGYVPQIGDKVVIGTKRYGNVEKLDSIVKVG